MDILVRAKKRKKILMIIMVSYESITYDEKNCNKSCARKIVKSVSRKDLISLLYLK